MTGRTKSLAKRTIHRFFALFGLRIARNSGGSPKGAEKYFNTGALSPLEENSVDLYDRFYGDHRSLKEYYDPQRLSFYSAVSEFLRISGVLLDGKDVVDVGCGTGHLLAELQKWSRPRSLTGCDFSQSAVDFSGDQFPGCRFFRHDVYDPLPREYDVLFCTEVLEHLERPWTALANLSTALREGGTMVLTVPNGRVDNAIEHINFWSPESWKAFLTAQCPHYSVTTSPLRGGHYNIALVQRPLPKLKNLVDNK